MKRIIAFSLFFALVGLLAGCSGSNSVLPGTPGGTAKSTGQFKVTIQWPTQVAKATKGSRLIPEMTQSIKLDIAQGSTADIVPAQTVNRPADGTDSTVTFTGIPMGAITVSAMAYSTANANGVELAYVSIPATIVAKITVMVTATVLAFIPITKTNPADGATMMWVPRGSFIMGNNLGGVYPDESPAHQVTLSGYWIYKYDVTVAQYLAFCRATKRNLPTWPGNIYSWAGKSGWSDPALQQHPIVCVNWDDAMAYAAWAGVSLPTEAQWEYAARGPAENNYPWGGRATADDPYNGWDQTKCANAYNSYNQNISTWPVGSFSADKSWCRTYDMAGNVYQWCADEYGPYSSLSVTNPSGPSTGDNRVIRGGSWGNNGLDGGGRGAYRVTGGSTDASWGNLGFRCVSLAPGH